MNGKLQKRLELAADIVPHLADRRARAIGQAALSLRYPKFAPRAQGSLAAVERERARLLKETSEFDRREKPVTVERFTRRVSKSARWCRFLHVLTQRLKPDSVVEMGTGVGISGAAIGTALAKHGRMWTVDLRPESGRLARAVFERVGADVEVVTGRFDEVLEDVLIQAGPVDLLFVDGHHNEEATLGYTEQAAAHLSAHAVVVYDDIRWSPGMHRAWQAIRTQQHWSFSVDLGEIGVCAVDKRRVGMVSRV